MCVLSRYFISLAMSYGYFPNDEFFEYETEVCFPVVAGYCLQRFSVLSWDIKIYLCMPHYIGNTIHWM